VRELEHHARLEPADATGALACVRDLRRQTDLMHQPAAGASALTDAELAVLHHLPTNLSLADIAARLYVSRNTVKSHTAAIYRKLGANSRGEAVELARAAGLLEAVAPS
jgi:LuxR family transcriptional regulator, maltose regulon positive regulatory protein